MSKLATLALVVLLFVSSGPGLVTAQQPVASADKAADATRAAAELAVPVELVSEVARLRGLEILRPVSSGLKSREDINALVLDDLKENSTPERIAIGTAMLKFLGLVGDDFDLGRETVSLLTEQIAGFYDPKTKIFYLADWIPMEEQRTVIVHELTHALADQHFDLRRLEKWPDGDADAELAARALVEGDATALMFAFTLYERNLPHQLGSFPVSLTDMLRRMVQESEGDRPVFSKTPKVLRESLQFPYVYGAGFVQRLLREGSWARVGDAYRTFPASTEQVMHPEKYLKGEMPVRIELPDLAPLLGAGFKRVDADVNGEFGYYLILEAQLGDREASDAAAGWGGDRYHFYVDRDNASPVLVHESAWDTEADAAEFYSAYAERTRRRIAASGSGEIAPNVRQWKTDAGTYHIERSGLRVIAIEGFRGRDVNSIVTSVKSHAMKRP